MKGYAAKLQAFSYWQLAFGSWLLAKINENEDENENHHPDGL